MPIIELLDQITIDKIAAGEVVERPASVVKELVENAIDAKASVITVEIKEGGIAFIRVTDNGVGMERPDLQKAFLRHSTSKIHSIQDLDHIRSLGFRGEALSSIAAVSQVTLLTKRREDEIGSQYEIHGGREVSLDDAAVNDGTTFLVRQLFYNVPVRRKFLKSVVTEAGHVYDLLLRLSLSHPEISFQFINNGNTKLHTSGNNDLKDVIYRLYGREIAQNLIKVDVEASQVKISGYIAKPIISRGNRNYQHYFINGRYIKSHEISLAVENAYKGYTMQHRYPFTVLHLEIDGELVDVNVHPTKMEVRFQESKKLYDSIFQTITDALAQRDLIPQVTISEPKNDVPPKKVQIEKVPIENVQIEKVSKVPIMNQSNESSVIRETTMYNQSQENKKLDYFMEKMKQRVHSFHQPEVPEVKPIEKPKSLEETNSIEKIKPVEETKQLSFFEEVFISEQRKLEFRLIGQVFLTYWLIEYEEQLYIIDQHAAHEKVLYERTLNNLKNKEVTTQYLSPPMILHLTMQEKNLLETYITEFTSLGFELEEFGGDSYAIRGVPDNLYSIDKKELFIDMLDQLSENLQSRLPSTLILEKIASTSCKAAVKGNQGLSMREVEQLIEDLLGLENPFHCPHGRPTIVSMSKKEMEKKFKRIL